jgi:hypothetical protein
MAEQRTDIPLAEGLSCTLDATQEHPERYATILGGEKPLQLSKVQALALFRVMLSHLGQFAGDEMQDGSELVQVNVVQAFHRSIEWLSHWSPTELEEDPDLLIQAHEHYQHTYALQEEMLEAVNVWQTTLEQEYSKLEEAAEEVGVALDELGDEDDQWEESDEDDEME